MQVRLKTWLPAIATGAFLVLGAGQAAAQCATCQLPPAPTPPGCGGGGGGCVPGVPSVPGNPGNPGFPGVPGNPGSGAGCSTCQPPPAPGYPGKPGWPGHGGSSWNQSNNWNSNSNVNVNVNINGGGNASASARSYINARAGAGATVYYGGGGGAYFSVDQPYPTSIQGLNVDGGMASQVIQVPYQSMRRSMKQVVIQAVCIDDRNIPHPASQVRPDREVSEGYAGELYRCIAGSRLQATIADYLGQVSFDGGDTLACSKGEALWFGEGILECRPEKRERDCHERSLLRRYGAGVKILTLYREESYTEYREEVVQTAGAAISGGSMVLDGGVGGRVF